MRLRIVTGSLLAGSLLFAADTRDPKAAEIAQDMQKAMGGQEAWNAARFVRFDFKVNIGGETKVDRSHLWDKQTGRYRLDQKNRVPVGLSRSVGHPIASSTWRRFTDLVQRAIKRASMRW